MNERTGLLREGDGVCAHNYSKESAEWNYDMKKNLFMNILTFWTNIRILSSPAKLLGKGDN
jgi:hypothetical protein